MHGHFRVVRERAPQQGNAGNHAQDAVDHLGGILGGDQRYLGRADGGRQLLPGQRGQIFDRRDALPGGIRHLFQGGFQGGHTVKGGIKGGGRLHPGHHL